MKIYLAFLLILGGFLSLSAHGDIIATSDDFSTNANTFPSWVVTSPTNTITIHDAVSANDFDVNDLIPPAGTEATGDGVQGDGGLRLGHEEYRSRR